MFNVNTQHRINRLGVYQYTCIGKIRAFSLDFFGNHVSIRVPQNAVDRISAARSLSRNLDECFVAVFRFTRFSHTQEVFIPVGLH